MKYSLIIPTYNAGESWNLCINSILTQSFLSMDILVVDSSSQDSTVELALNHQFHVEVIPVNEFNHGGTRNLSANKIGGDIIIFITQDIIFDNKCAIEKIVNCFKDPLVGAAYGRQLPHKNANPIASHARDFNYLPISQIKDKSLIEELGIKTVFISNSFSAYRASLFYELDGFPNDTILAEDMFLAAKMIKAGYKVAYCAEATVRHSHNYTPWEEFKRYFDTGVFHCEQPWIRQEFGGAGGEGLKYIKSEIRYLLKNAPFWIPRSLVTNAMKLLGYKLGQNYKKIPDKLVKNLSMHKGYWK